jgi:hypothetical protein
MGLVDVQEDATSTDPVDPGNGKPAGHDDLDDSGKMEDTDVDELQEDESKKVRKLSEKHLQAIHANWEVSWAPLQRSCKGKVSRHFMSLRAQCLANLERQSALPAAIHTDTPGLIGRVLFNLTDANKSVKVLLSPLFRESLRLGGEQAMQEDAEARGSEEAGTFRINDPKVEQALRRREIRVTDINNTVRKELRDQLAEGLKAEETTAQLAERIRTTFGIASNRASTIARTEIGGAVEEARQIGRGQAGTPMKSWLWSRKETGRQNHMETEAQTMDHPVPNAEDFTLAESGVKAAFPRGSGVAEEDINCGCTTLARYPGDSVKDVIARYTRGFLTYDQLTARTGTSNAS